MNNLPIWYLVLGGLLSIITVAGNGIVIYLIVTRHRLHTTANWFILSLAIADLILGLSYLLTGSLSNVLSYPTSNYNIWYAINSFLAAASATTNLCLMTLDRYIAIVKPLKYVTFMTTRRVVLLISTAWLASFLPHFVLFLRFVVFTTPNEDPNELLKGFVIFDCVVFETLPIVILPFATGHLFLVARRHSRQTAVLMAQLRFNQTIENNQAFTQNQETSSVKMIVVAVMVFLICYVNEFCYTFLNQLPDRKTQPNEVFFYIMELLYIIISAVNPVVYAFFKKDIKKNLRNMFHCTRQTNKLQPRAFRTERSRVPARESTV